MRVANKYALNTKRIEIYKLTKNEKVGSIYTPHSTKDDYNNLDMFIGWPDRQRNIPQIVKK